MLQSLSEWVSSNPDVSDHIKHLVKVAVGFEASGALLEDLWNMRISLLIAPVVHQKVVVSEVLYIN